MSPTAVALAWAIPGLAAALFATRSHRRLPAALVPMAAAIAAAFSLGGGADQLPVLPSAGLSLGAPAAGMVLVGALAMSVGWLLAPPGDAGEILAGAAAGALGVVALSTGSPLVWGLCLLSASLLIAVSRVAAAPSRATLAGARITALGAGALLAAAPFLPVDETLPDPRLRLAGGLLATGIAALLALVPFGGWLTGAGRASRPASLLPYVVLVLPAVVLPAQALQLALPSGSRAILGWVMLPLGSVTVAWSAFMALTSSDRDRYPRVLVADLGLVALGLVAQEDSARLGSLILLLTHMVAAPLLLGEPAAEPARPRRFAWLAVSGIPPTPAAWGRLSLVIGLVAAYGAPPLVVALPAIGAIIAVSLRAIAAARAAPPSTMSVGRAAPLAAWLVPLGGLGFGLAPLAIVRALLGVG